MRIGYAAMLEQFAPAEVIDLCVAAERHGFDGVIATDHFQPWLPRHGTAAHVWTMLGAIGAHIRGDLGPAATTPTFRTHPAVVAQAAATLASLYPGRVWLGVGSGEALNEHVVGEYWPEPGERIEHMFEAVEIIRKLFASAASGRLVKHRGARFRVESTRLWTVPTPAPPIYVATAGPVTARRAGRSADGLVTTGEDFDRAAQLLARFADGAREAGRDLATMERVLHLHVSWAPTDEEALAAAMTEWPMAGLRIRRGDIRSPYDFEQLVRGVRTEEVTSAMLVSSDPDAHRAHIQRYADLGFTRIFLHNVGRDQREWLEVFGRDVLPKVRG
ncbi:TIGR03557 family F420-dependent LLM class oxidoreductase [Microbacterium sp. No. 7]|uniref:TIGR03557 family F420-dependent LLM class oxidoreductase n=1 Tax=Microbacterium sp. No. 7 TaxID=1714373 RepID=UPI0006D23A2D|nr:TIGR03557 family F420-dependent LLM class oxidoreductase [Microbacterium sp. No. 7]ALJ21837.1 luciferase [Microbacterium sp. No. 7]